MRKYRPKKGEPGYAEFRERENARQREISWRWKSRQGADREARNEYCRMWREAHPGYHREKYREWRRANPERIREIRRAYRARKRLAAVNGWICDLAVAVSEATA